MRPILRTLAALVGLFVFSALIDVGASVAGIPTPLDMIAHADTIDAGPAGGVASSPLTVTAPAPQVVVPDAVEHPAEAVSTVTDTYKHNGIWVAMLMVAYILLSAAAKRTGPGSLLGNGRVAMAVSGFLATSGSALDWRLGHATWAVPLTTLVIAIAAFISPHVVHTDTLEGASLGGGKGG